MDRAIAIHRTHSDLIKFAYYDSEYEQVAHILSQIYSRSADTGSRDNAIKAINTAPTSSQEVAISESARDASSELINRAHVQSHSCKIPEAEQDLLSSISENFHIPGKYPEDEAIHQQAPQLRDKMFGCDNSDTLTSMDSLGFTLHKQSDPRRDAVRLAREHDSSMVDI